jgi:uncharacterized glyoxalase superfamily protein PhnB
MTKRRAGEPWMPAEEYGPSLPTLTVNLLVSDMARALAFYREVLLAEVRYDDPDFAALRLLGVDLMLHADHAYDGHPWYPSLRDGERRGLGAELRLFGMDPDSLVTRARARGAAVLGEPADKPHGWREAWVQDPEGYVWAVGKAIR